MTELKKFKVELPSGTVFVMAENKWEVMERVPNMKAIDEVIDESSVKIEEVVDYE